MGYECGFSAIDKRITNIYKLKKSFPTVDGLSISLSEFIYTAEAEIANAIENNVDWEGISNSDLKDIYTKNEYDQNQLTKDYDFWCSIGRYISEFIGNTIKIQRNAYYNLITKDDIINILCALVKEYFDYDKIKHYDIVSGIIENYEDRSQKVISIDGIELRNVETDEYVKVLNCSDCADFQYLDMSSDIDGVFTSLARCLCDILQNNDFDSYDIIFWESY